MKSCAFCSVSVDSPVCFASVFRSSADAAALIRYRRFPAWKERHLIDALQQLRQLPHQRGIRGRGLIRRAAV